VHAALGFDPPKIFEYNGAVLVVYIDPRNGKEWSNVFFRTEAECEARAEAIAHWLDRYR
jgi:hypothetical protein